MGRVVSGKPLKRRQVPRNPGDSRQGFERNRASAAIDPRPLTGARPSSEPLQVDREAVSLPIFVTRRVGREIVRPSTMPLGSDESDIVKRLQTSLHEAGIASRRWSIIRLASIVWFLGNSVRISNRTRSTVICLNLLAHARRRFERVVMAVSVGRFDFLVGNHGRCQISAIVEP